MLTSGFGNTPAQSVLSIKRSEPHTAFGDTVREMSNNIMVIYQDTKDNFWFGSWQDGLYKYDGNSMIHFTSKDGLLSNRVEEIKEDNLGNVYINTSKGLCQYKGGRFLTISETMDAYSSWTLKPDDLWFKCLEYNGYVYRLDGNNLYKLQLPKSKLGEDYMKEHPNYPNPYQVYCIYKDSNHNIWFGTSTLGVCRYNGISFDWISEQDLTEIHNGPSNGVRSIVEDKSGYFWFNTAYRYNVYNRIPGTKANTENAIFYDRIKSIGCLDGNEGGDLNEYLSIIKDDKNNLWIAFYLHGVWKFDGENIIHYPIEVNAKNIPIYSLYKDKNGNIWLGTHENGVYKFNGQAFDKFGL